MIINLAACDKKFAIVSKLFEDSWKTSYTGDKPFNWSQCDYKCSRSNNLKQHEKSHIGVND